MRQWHVNTSMMCRKHLLGEHVEHHMMIGTLIRGRSLTGFVQDGLIAPLTIISRHNEIAEEMLSRGYNHKSEILDSVPNNEMLIEAVEKYGTGHIDREANTQELIRRCPDCRYYMWEFFGPYPHVSTKEIKNEKR